MDRRVIWGDDTVSCHVATRGEAPQYLVEVFVHGDPIWSKAFASVSDAERETERLRKLFVEKPPS